MSKMWCVLLMSALAGCGGKDVQPDTTQSVRAQSRQAQRSDKAAASNYDNLVQSLYVAYFGRPADPSGLAQFENALVAANAPTTVAGLAEAYSGNATVKGLIDGFGTSKESIALYGSGTTSNFVAAVFQNVLGRAPQAAGLAYWSNAIDCGAVSKGNAALAIMAGALANTSAQGLLDAQTIANRLAIADYFTAQIEANNDANFYAGATAAASARAMLAAVTSNTNTATYQADVDADVAAIAVAGGKASYSIGGTVFGLASGEKITLQDNAAGALAITGNAGYQFPARLPGDNAYSVTIAQDPLAQTCSVANASGHVAGNVTNADVSCTASSVVNLHTLTGGADGAYPYGGLTPGTDGSFYGASCYGGDKAGLAGDGVIYKLTPSGTGFTYSVIHVMNGTTDGKGACGQMVLGSDGNIYGITNDAGNADASGGGTIFKLSKTGDTYTYTVLYVLNRTTDGRNISADLMQAKDGSFYGAACSGGTMDKGTIFRLAPTGSGYAFSVLYTFRGQEDGACPASGLLQANDGNFYGTSFTAGNTSVNAGTAFQLVPTGNSYTFNVLHTFNGSSDGSHPLGTLIQGVDGYIYGTTSGNNDEANRYNGSIFKLSPFLNTYLFTVVYTLNGGSDGAFPYQSLTQGADGSLYGVAMKGGDAAADAGTIFKLTTGSAYNFSVLHAFNGTTDGTNPFGKLLVGPDGHFYGTTISIANTANDGSVFRF